MNYTIPQDSTWEIGINDAGNFDPSVKELAHRIEVAVGFKPIHNFLPETIKSQDINEAGGIKPRFISLASGTGNETSDNLYARGVSPLQSVDSKYQDSKAQAAYIQAQKAQLPPEPEPSTDLSLPEFTSFTSTGGSGLGSLNNEERELANLNQGNF